MYNYTVYSYNNNVAGYVVASARQRRPYNIFDHGEARKFKDILKRGENKTDCSVSTIITAIIDIMTIIYIVWRGASSVRSGEKSKRDRPQSTTAPPLREECAAVDGVLYVHQRRICTFAY